MNLDTFIAQSLTQVATDEPTSARDEDFQIRLHQWVRHLYPFDQHKEPSLSNCTFGPFIKGEHSFVDRSTLQISMLQRNWALTDEIRPLQVLGRNFVDRQRPCYAKTRIVVTNSAAGFRDIAL
jgi:hypothetical protein